MSEELHSTPLSLEWIKTLSLPHAVFTALGQSLHLSIRGRIHPISNCVRRVC